MRIVAALLALALVLIPGCGDDSDSSAAEATARLEGDWVPGELHGLDVKRENIDPLLKKAEKPYLDAAALFSLRNDKDALQATLQVGHFADAERADDPDFRLELLNTIGGGQALELRMGGHPVFLTSSQGQTIAVWFRAGHLFVLSSRVEYDFPRGLLRDALEVVPA